MASAEAKKLWVEMKKDSANRVCIECGGNDPTWASVSFGNLFCLECSGVHRSLGVHISFVRSLGMDKWSDEQLKFMRNGGNAKCKQFFKKHGIPDSMSIADRYHTEVANTYKEKLKSIVHGTPWKEPQVGSLSTVPKRPEPKRTNINPQNQQQKKYSGMGNYTAPKEADGANDWGSLFSSGLTTLTSVASIAAATTGQYAKTAAEKLTETSSGLTEKVQQTNWSETVSTLGTSVAETTNSGWGTLSSYWQTAKQYTEQALVGEEANPVKKTEPIDQNWVAVADSPKEDTEWDNWEDEPKQDEKPKSSRLHEAMEEISLSDEDPESNVWTSEQIEKEGHDGWDEAMDSDGDEWEAWS